MPLSAEDYREAAQERVSAARVLFNATCYVESAYLSGVAVECILRAYRVRVDPAFDSRHDLAELLKDSAFADFVPQKRRAEVSAALGIVWARWKNDYRYFPPYRYKSALRDAGHLSGFARNSDPLKENARLAFNKATYLVNTGVERWSKKSEES